MYPSYTEIWITENFEYTIIRLASRMILSAITSEVVLLKVILQILFRFFSLMNIIWAYCLGYLMLLKLFSTNVSSLRTCPNWVSFCFALCANGWYALDKSI